MYYQTIKTGFKYRMSRCLSMGVMIFASTLAHGQDAGEELDDEEDIIELSPFVVTEDDGGGYLVTNSTAGTSLNMMIRDIPVSLEVLNREMLDDLQATNLEESLIYSAGVFTDNYRANSSATGAFADRSPSAIGNFDDPFQNLVSIRGYSVPNQQRAGFRVGAVINAYGVVLGGSTDGILTERVEVVRGPQSLLYGINVLSGVTNLEPKRPLAEFRTKVSLGVGSDNEFRATLDTTGPILKDKLNYRVLSAFQSFDDQQDQIDFRKYERQTYALQFDIFPFSTPKTRIFVEYVHASQKSEGIGPQTFSTGTLRDEWGETFNFGRDDPTYPFYIPNSPDGDVFDQYFQDHQLSHIPGYEDYVADGIEDGPLVKQPKNEQYYDFRDRGRTFNVSGPDTYKIQKENNLLVQLYHSFSDNLHLELGVYHTEVDIEERNVSLNTFWNEDENNGIFGLNEKPYGTNPFQSGYVDWFENPELIAADVQNDRIGRGIGEVFIFPTAQRMGNLVDPTFSELIYSAPRKTYDPDLVNGQNQSAFFIDPTNGYTEKGVDRVYAYYFWYEKPSTSESNQIRGRLAYDFKTDFLNIDGEHTIVVGYHFTEDDVAFLQGSGGSPGTHYTRYLGTSNRSTEDYQGNVANDAIYFRNSVFDTEPIRYNGENIAFANNLNVGNLGGLRLDGKEENASYIGRSGYKEVQLWFRGLYGIYRGQFWKDKLTIIGGVRHDAYQGKEREQLLILDRQQLTGLSTGGSVDQSIIPQLYGFYGDQPWESRADRPDSLNANIARSVDQMRASMPNGTIEHTYDKTQTFNTKTFSASYRITEDVSAYVAYSEGVFPNTGFRDGAYNPIDAEQTKNKEIGLKFDLFDGKLSGTVSFYNIRRSNAITQWNYAPRPSAWQGGPENSDPTGTEAFSPLNTFQEYTLNKEIGVDRVGYISDLDDPNLSPYRGSIYLPLGYGISPRYYELAREQLGLGMPAYGSGGISKSKINDYGDNNNNEVIAIFDRGNDLDNNDGPNSNQWIVVDYENALRDKDPNTDVWKRAFELAMDNALVHGPPDAPEPGDPVDILSGELLPYGGAGINYSSHSDPFLNNPSGKSGGLRSPTLVTFEEEGNGIDGQIVYSPTKSWQVVFNFSHQKREVVGNGLNLVDPIGPDGQGGLKNWGTEYDVWVYILGAENFEDPTRPSTYNGESVRGLDLSYVPRKSGGLLTHYTFSNGPLKNLRIGGGMQYEGEVITATAIGGQRLEENRYLPPNRPARVVFNAFARYKFELWDVNWGVQLNVNNIADHTYDIVTATYENELDQPVYRRTEAYYRPRIWRLSLTAEF
jgi:outer membrane receptor for ferric coprogen and ferric-rhodotorulic acid